MTLDAGLDRRFAWALAASLGAHAAALSIAPPVTKRLTLEPPALLQVSLREPVTVVKELERALPEVVKPTPIKRTPPKRETKVPVAPTAPSPPALAPEVPLEATNQAPPEPPLAVAPFIAPVEPAPPPVPFVAPAPTLPEPVPTAELLAGYGKRISDALARYKEYPRIAQMRGWEGEVTMRLRVAPSGRLVDAQLHRSSGYDVLDKQAIAMATRAAQLPVPPEGLNGAEVAVLVPVVFRLER